MDLKKVRCHFCKRKGHFARDGFKKKADQKKPPIAEFAKKVEKVSRKCPEVALATGGTSMKGDEWWIDSGASQHMTPTKKGMAEYESFRIPVKVKLADNSTLLARAFFNSVTTGERSPVGPMLSPVVNTKITEFPQ